MNTFAVLHLLVVFVAAASAKTWCEELRDDHNAGVTCDAAGEYAPLQCGQLAGGRCHCGYRMEPLRADKNALAEAFCAWALADKDNMIATISREDCAKQVGFNPTFTFAKWS